MILDVIIAVLTISAIFIASVVSRDKARAEIKKEIEKIVKDDEPTK